MLKEWASLAIKEKYNISPDKLEFKENKNLGKNKFHTTAFEVNLKKATNSVIPLHDNPEQGVFAQVGDARRTPYYRYTHGANDAILGGVAFADCVDTQNPQLFNQTQFNNRIDKNGCWVRIIDAIHL